MVFERALENEELSYFIWVWVFFFLVIWVSTFQLKLHLSLQFKYHKGSVQQVENTTTNGVFFRFNILANIVQNVD